MRQQYIVMPVEGWTSDRMFDFYDKQPIAEIVRRSQGDVAASSVDVKYAAVVAVTPLALEAAGAAPYDVLASSHENGPKLCLLPKETVRLLRVLAPTATLEPNRKVYAAVRAAARVRPAPDWANAPEPGRIRIRVVDAQGQPVPGARVIAYADPVLPIGAARKTRRNGVAIVPTAADTVGLARLAVEPPPGFAPTQLNGVSAAGGDVTVVLREVDPLTMSDALARWRVGLPPNSGQGVRIGIVDTGVNPAHPDLAHVYTSSAYSFDPPGPLGDPHPHANHVAGIIGARGLVFRGLAPNAELFSYRVTPVGEKDTSSFFLGDGIEKAAINHDLHLINVSMTQKASSAYLAKAAVAAYQNGAVCIGAVGNDGRDIVSHPAAAKRFIGVSAYCDRLALAADAPEAADVTDVVSSAEADLSRAKFSNWGSEVDFIAPGVAIISCRGATGYATDSGTSFAAPIVTGLAAVMLSRDFPHILAMPKGSKRAAAITQALLTRGRDLGFKFETQGNGILDV